MIHQCLQLVNSKDASMRLFSFLTPKKQRPPSPLRMEVEKLGEKIDMLIDQVGALQGHHRITADTTSPDANTEAFSTFEPYEEVSHE